MRGRVRADDPVGFAGPRLGVRVAGRARIETGGLRAVLIFDTEKRSGLSPAARSARGGFRPIIT